MEVFFFLAAFFSELIGSIAGFGSSTVFLPLALLFIDFKSALVLIALFHVFGNIGRITFFRHGLDKSILLKFGLPSVCATLLGALLVSLVSQDLLKGLLGIFLTVYSIISLVKDKFKIKLTLRNLIIGGGISGFLAGLIGTGGALRAMFFTSLGIKKEKYMATAAAVVLATDLTRIPVYFSQRFLDSKFYWYIPVLFIIAFLGSFIGKQIVDRIPQKQFKKLVLIAILAIGLKFSYEMMRR